MGKASLSAEATELKERCKGLEGDKESLSKLNAKLEEEKQQLNHAMGTRSILDNSMEDKLANLEKLYKEEVRSKKRLETELMNTRLPSWRRRRMILMLRSPWQTA